MTLQTLIQRRAQDAEERRQRTMALRGTLAQEKLQRQLLDDFGSEIAGSSTISVDDAATARADYDDGTHQFTLTMTPTTWYYNGDELTPVRDAQNRNQERLIARVTGGTPEPEPAPAPEPTPAPEPAPAPEPEPENA